MKSADMMSVTKYAGCRALRSGNVPALLSRFPLNFHGTNALNDLFPVQARLPYQGEASGKFWRMIVLNTRGALDGRPSGPSSIPKTCRRIVRLWKDDRPLANPY